MDDEARTYNELMADGWMLDAKKGVQTSRFTSVSFRLDRDGLRVKSVQGYGVTREAAIEDTVAEANAWLRAEKIAALHRDVDRPIAQKRRAGRGSRTPEGSLC